MILQILFIDFYYYGVMISLIRCTRSHCKLFVFNPQDRKINRCNRDVEVCKSNKNNGSNTSPSGFDGIINIRKKNRTDEEQKQIDPLC